ncbi:class I SAM-dependent methyltransferase [Vibrio penaeicida]|uniref:Class I SAM-dependent methyltransferase n=1 Tax=Vibrio penaeicida TaxID=104609 RepID=A0AAV5NVW7_9VIBR|nr:class I SAM-dependent methyltransferase [Vibrio penaeicida]GLQ74568.1 hypothetical protein GCM10007932_39290 [Vibrio penaeicida]
MQYKIASLIPVVLKTKILDYFATHPYIKDKIERERVNDETKHYGLTSAQALSKLLRDFKFQSILDIGSGEGRHTDIFLENGKSVTALDYGESVYFKKCSDSKNVVKCDYYKYQPKEKFDCIWASHVLEHQPDTHKFLSKVYSDLKDDGIAALTVPPLKHEIVGGHVNLYNAGLLLYQMILAGFDCRNASIHTYDYNISIIVRKDRYVDLSGLTFDSGDINYLKQYFPVSVQRLIAESDLFDGRLYNINW